MRQALLAAVAFVLSFGCSSDSPSVGVPKNCPASPPAIRSGYACDQYAGNTCAWPVEGRELRCKCTAQGQNTFTWECGDEHPDAGADIPVPQDASVDASGDRGGDGSADASVDSPEDSRQRCPTDRPAAGDGCGGIASPETYLGATCSWTTADASTLTCTCTNPGFNAYVWQCGGGGQNPG
jgi:hypothetical protein